MTFIIHYNGDYEDSIMISGETIEEVRAEAVEACQKRGWDYKDCWSEET